MELEYLPSMSDSEYDNWLARRHLVNIAAAAVVAFYLHCLAIIMSSSQAPSAISQQWTDQETEAILQYFITHNSKIGDAGNFKKKTYLLCCCSNHPRTDQELFPGADKMASCKLKPLSFFRSHLIH